MVMTFELLNCYENTVTLAVCDACVSCVFFQTFLSFFHTLTTGSCVCVCVLLWTMHDLVWGGDVVTQRERGVGVRGTTGLKRRRGTISAEILL